MIYEYRCESCGQVSTESVPMAMRDEPMQCACGSIKKRVYCPPATIIPQWMQDASITSRARHREWLKSDKAKKMDLSPCRNDE